MSDFTKDELGLIHGSLAANIRMFMEPDSIYKLREKIQSLLDNYCEHAEAQANHNYEVDQCKKCGKLFVG